MSTYHARLERDEVGRWSSWMDDLPSCAAWGYTREEAVAALSYTAVAYVADIVEACEMAPYDAVIVIHDPTTEQ